MTLIFSNRLKISFQHFPDHFANIEIFLLIILDTSNYYINITF